MLLASVLATAGVCYAANLLIVYLQVTSSSALLPDLQAVDTAFFGQAQAVSTIERLLESADGPMNRAGTMRPAFTEQSVGWKAASENLTADEKAELVAQRDGERLALLAWIRSGPSREAFEADDFFWNDTDATHAITTGYLVSGLSSAEQSLRRVRIRSIVMDRCATCHADDGRHELARWIPLDTYESIERHCRPEAGAIPGRPWLIASLVGLLPLALLSGPLFYLTGAPLATRIFWLMLPGMSLIVAGSCWFLGQPGTSAVYVLLVTAGVALIGVLIQIVASLAELLGQKPLA